MKKYCKHGSGTHHWEIVSWELEEAHLNRRIQTPTLDFNQLLWLEKSVNHKEPKPSFFLSQKNIDNAKISVFWYHYNAQMQYCIWWAGATNSTTSSSQVSLRILLFRHFFLTRWLVLFKLQPKDLTLFCSPAYYKQNWLASDYAFKFHWRQWLIFGWLRWASEYTRISNNGQLVKKLNALHHQPGNLPLPACSLNCKAQPRWTKQGLHCTSKELCLLFSYSFPPSTFWHKLTSMKTSIPHFYGCSYAQNR